MVELSVCLDEGQSKRDFSLEEHLYSLGQRFVPGISEESHESWSLALPQCICWHTSSAAAWVQVALDPDSQKELSCCRTPTRPSHQLLPFKNTSRWSAEVIWGHPEVKVQTKE